MLDFIKVTFTLRRVVFMAIAISCIAFCIGAVLGWNDLSRMQAVAVLVGGLLAYEMGS